MKYSFGDVSDQKSRAAKIRALFVGSTIQEHTERWINAGLWTESELRAVAARGLRAEVRDALGQITEDGVPWAGPTSTRRPPAEDESENSAWAPVWRQLDFWSKKDFDYNYTAYKNSAKAFLLFRVLSPVARSKGFHRPECLPPPSDCTGAAACALKVCPWTFGAFLVWRQLAV
jgi:hypothetical protein